MQSSDYDKRIRLFYEYVTNLEASDYPTELDVDDPFTTFIGIINHESNNAEYLVRVTHLRYTNEPTNINSQAPVLSSIEYSQQFSLLNLETAVFEYSNSFEQSGFWVVKYDLFSNDLATNDTNPYRTLQLNIIVN